jgi:hypothetical protein
LCGIVFVGVVLVNFIGGLEMTRMINSDIIIQEVINYELSK